MRINQYVEHITEINKYFKTWLAESESPSRALSPGFMHQNKYKWMRAVEFQGIEGEWALHFFQVTYFLRLWLFLHMHYSNIIQVARRTQM